MTPFRIKSKYNVNINASKFFYFAGNPIFELFITLGFIIIIIIIIIQLNLTSLSARSKAAEIISKKLGLNIRLHKLFA
jgi:hypothetical protein